MASGAASPDIRVYIKDYEPCGRGDLPGHRARTCARRSDSGHAGRRPYPGLVDCLLYVAFSQLHAGVVTCSNALEKEAYDFANGIVVQRLRRRGQSPRLRGHGPARSPATAARSRGRSPTPSALQTYAEAIKAAGLVKTGSDVGRTWCSLLTWPASLIAGAFSIFGFSNLGGAIGAGAGVVIGGIIGGWFGFVLGAILGGPFGAAIGAFLGALLGSSSALIGGAIGWAISEIGDWIGGLFSGPSARIWFTAFDGADWVIPDVPVSQNGHSLTSQGPAMALFNSKLFLAYKGKDSDDLWFNTFDGHSWLATDLEITQNGHSKTDARPALAVFNGKLFLAYKGSGSDRSLVQHL